VLLGVRREGARQGSDDSDQSLPRIVIFVCRGTVRCQLDVVGTGLTAEGNPTFDYRGTCTFRGPRNR